MQCLRCVTTFQPSIEPVAEAQPTDACLEMGHVRSSCRGYQFETLASGCAGSHGFNGGRSGTLFLAPAQHDIEIDYVQVHAILSSASSCPSAAGIREVTTSLHGNDSELALTSLVGLARTIGFVPVHDACIRTEAALLLQQLDAYGKVDC